MRSICSPYAEKKTIKAEIQKLLLGCQRWPLIRHTKCKLIQGGQHEHPVTRTQQVRKTKPEISAYFGL